MAPKTVIEKAESPSQDVTVFRIAGTLGFHEKSTLEKLIAECRKRSMNRIVLDMSDLRSLGGGCAQILRDEARSGAVVLGIAGATSTTLKFLSTDPVAQIVVADTVAAAIEAVLATQPQAAAAAAPAHSDRSDDDLVTDEVLEEILATREPVGNQARSDGAAKAPVKPTATVAAATATSGSRKGSASESADTKDLHRRIVQYNTIFALNSDFSRIQDRKSLLDLFLLTTIAQVGVESAVFLEHSQGYFFPAAMKGIEPSEVRGLAVPAEQFRLEEWQKQLGVRLLNDAPFVNEVKATLASIGCIHVAPFVVHGTFRGIILLGKPIKHDLDESTQEFFRMLINQAALAYGSMTRVEEENERTLGLVQTLISLIEENTLARGNTNMISNYVLALARHLHYPDEHIRDLMYGTVLRDIGMIKVSDLIVRSPRELMPEEWDIIKRHPIDGAEMLRRMRFSEHSIGVVRAHHERFNGEGYPDGLQGQDIPVGSRIISVVESYAAMLQERPTRPALTSEEAIHTLAENWGMRYDPEVIDAFSELLLAEQHSGKRVGSKRFELFSV